MKQKAKRQPKSQVKSTSAVQVEDLFEKAWLFRNRRKLEDCWMILAEMKDILGVSKKVLSIKDIGMGIENLKSDQTVRVYTDLFMLEASLERARNDMVRSKELIAMFKKELTSAGRKIPFQVHFQDGLNQYSEARYSQALECLSRAKPLAVQPVDTALVLVSIISALWSMGVNWESPLSELKELIQANVFDEDAKLVLQPILVSIEQFEDFLFWIKGDVSYFADAISSLSKMTGDDFRLSRIYFFILVNQLPYVRQTDRQKHELESLTQRMIQDDHDAFLRSERIRTILGKYDSKDLGLTAYDSIERIYFWFWRFAMDLNPATIRGVLLHLEKVEAQLVQGVSLNLSASLMLRNTVKWLSLFDPSIKHAFPQAYRYTNMTLGRSKIETPLLDLESEWIDQIAKKQWIRKDCDNLAMRLTELTGVTCHFDDLDRFIQSTLDLCVSYPFEEVSLFVDIESGEVVQKGHAGRVYSDLLAKALCDLYELQSIRLSDFALSVFGIRKFDSFVHGPKISNFLSKLRGCLPEGDEIVQKGQLINLSRTSHMSSVVIRKPTAHSLAIRSALDSIERPSGGDSVRDRIRDSSHDGDLKQSHSKLTSVQKLDPSILRSLGSDVSRQDIEKLLSTSKSTATRIINTWVDEGVLSTTGSTKDRRYRVNRA